MKRILPVCAALLLGCSLGAWAQSDTQFAKAAAAGGMAEVKLGQLAADKGSSDFVKQFGQKMVDDHSKANDKLKEVAQKDNITLPTDIMPKDQALYDRLSKLSGAAFDSAYIKAMTADHKKDVADFQKEASGGQNADVKSFASDTLPTIKMHLQMVEAKKMM
jgi:putative membrane protein